MNICNPVLGNTRNVLAICALTGCILPGSSLAQAILPFDMPTMISDVETVCTGVDSDSRADPRWNAYPLRLEITGKGGQYLGDVQITVEKDRKSVVQVTCGGPWLLLRVPPGRYQISATTENKTVNSIAVAPAKGQGRIIIRFPELGGALEAPESTVP